MQKLNKFLEATILKASNSSDKNAAISEALSTIRNFYKLDLRDVVELSDNLEFIYKLEGVNAAVYITATAKKTPRVWEKISYIIL